MARLILIEGTCGAGKTTLARALTGDGDVTWLQRETYGPIALAEDAGTLTGAANRAVLEGLIDRLEQLDRRLPGDARVVIDTLHITQRVRPGVLGEAGFRAVDNRLADLGVRLVFVSLADDLLAARLDARRDADFFRYASRVAGGADRVAAHFAAEQRALRALARRSRLPLIELDGAAPVGDQIATAIG